MALELI